MIARRWPAITSVVAGAAAVLAGLVVLFAPVAGPADAGPLYVSPSPPGSASAGSASAGSPSVGSASGAAPGAAPAVTPPGSAPATPAPDAAALAGSAPGGPPDVAPPAEPVEAGAPPVRLGIPAVRVNAPVVDAPVARSGTLAVPEDARRVGWWVGGAAAGASSGTLVLAGHVDDEKRSGALFRLSTVPMGAIVTVSSDTAEYRYRVTARRSYLKRKLPAALFTREGPHQLALITCGGPYRNGSYDNNVVVYAVPAP
ncbi:MAG TPA: class F sortase [Micromonosporaceae bacterium]|nr:class F sortase [Micromonosporaceae bacterium]